jgi:hypothetical protein
VAKKTTIPYWNVSRSEAWQEMQTTITLWNVSRSEWWRTKKTTVAEFGYLILVCNGVKVIGILKFQNSGENQYGSSNSWIFFFNFL